MLVKVPFGPRKINAFVVGIIDKTDFDKNKLREIANLTNEEVFFDKKMLELFKWVAGYYKSCLIKVIKAAIPAGVISGRVKKREKSYFRLANSVRYINEYIRQKELKAPKQVEVLKILLNSKEKNFTASKLADVAATYPGTIYQMRDRGLLENYRQQKIRRPRIDKEFKYNKPQRLTGPQIKAVNAVNEKIEEDSSAVFVLHGVTGSGKTEVYLQA